MTPPTMRTDPRDPMCTTAPVEPRTDSRETKRLRSTVAPLGTESLSYDPPVTVMTRADDRPDGADCAVASVGGLAARAGADSPADRIPTMAVVPKGVIRMIRGSSWETDYLRDEPSIGTHRNDRGRVAAVDGSPKL